MGLRYPTAIGALRLELDSPAVGENATQTLPSIGQAVFNAVRPPRSGFAPSWPVANDDRAERDVGFLVRFLEKAAVCLART